MTEILYKITRTYPDHRSDRVEYGSKHKADCTVRFNDPGDVRVEAVELGTWTDMTDLFPLHRGSENAPENRILGAIQDTTPWLEDSQWPSESRAAASGRNWSDYVDEHGYA